MTGTPSPTPLAAHSPPTGEMHPVLRESLEAERNFEKSPELQEALEKFKSKVSQPFPANENPRD